MWLRVKLATLIHFNTSTLHLYHLVLPWPCPVYQLLNISSIFFQAQPFQLSNAHKYILLPSYDFLVQISVHSRLGISNVLMALFWPLVPHASNLKLLSGLIIPSLRTFLFYNSLLLHRWNLTAIPTWWHISWHGDITICGHDFNSMTPGICIQNFLF